MFPETSRRALARPKSERDGCHSLHQVPLSRFGRVQGNYRQAIDTTLSQSPRAGWRHWRFLLKNLNISKCNIGESKPTAIALPPRLIVATTTASARRVRFQWHVIPISAVVGRPVAVETVREASRTCIAQILVGSQLSRNNHVDAAFISTFLKRASVLGTKRGSHASIYCPPRYRGQTSLRNLH